MELRLLLSSNAGLRRQQQEAYLAAIGLISASGSSRFSFTNGSNSDGYMYARASLLAYSTSDKVDRVSRAVLVFFVSYSTGSAGGCAESAADKTSFLVEVMALRRAVSCAAKPNSSGISNWLSV